MSKLVQLVVILLTSCFVNLLANGCSLQSQPAVYPLAVVEKCAQAQKSTWADVGRWTLFWTVTGIASSASMGAALGPMLGYKLLAPDLARSGLFGWWQGRTWDRREMDECLAEHDWWG